LKSTWEGEDCSEIRGDIFYPGVRGEEVGVLL